jgi:hypothetical protein
LAIPAAYANPGGYLGQLEDKAAATLADNDPFNALKQLKGKVPFYQSGARAYIKIGGKPIAVAQSIKWSISFQGTPIHTIDTVQPWDISVGSQTVSATLSQILDPTKGPEVDLLLPTMSSAIHHPYTEIQVLDALGTSLFFAKGMFLAVNGDISMGRLSSISAQFFGVFYQNYVGQAFKPYNSIAGGLSGLANSLGGLTSTLGGGLL